MENNELLQAIRQIVKEEISSQVEPLKQGQAKLEQGQAKLEQGQAKLEQGQAKLEQEVTKINITLENEVNKKLNLLFEGQQGMNEKFVKLDTIADDVEKIKITVNALEAMTRTNCTEIKKLKLVK